MKQYNLESSILFHFDLDLQSTPKNPRAPRVAKLDMKYAFLPSESSDPPLTTLIFYLYSATFQKRNNSVCAVLVYALQCPLQRTLQRRAFKKLRSICLSASVALQRTAAADKLLKTE